MITRSPGLVTAVGLTTVLSGCTVFPDRDPPRVMDIPFPKMTESAAPAFGKSLRVDTPQATEPFDSSRILNKPSPNEYQMYGKVRWRDTAPVLVRELIIATLRQEGRFSAVINETSPSASELTLTSDLYGFHSESHSGRTSVNVVLYGQIMDNRSRTTICTEDFQVSIEAAASDIDAVATAFADAGDELGAEVRDWLGNCLE